MRTRLFLILTLVLGPAGLSLAQPAPSGDDFLGPAPTPVTAMPALTDDDMAIFVRVNQVAEPMRKQAVEDYFSGLQEPDPQGGGREEWAESIRIALSGALGAEADVDKQACEQAGVDYQEFRSLLQRIRQVQQMLEMERELGGKRQRSLDFIASVEEKGVRKIAEEGSAFLQDMERATLEGRVLQEKEKNRRDAELRAKKRVGSNESRVEQIEKTQRKDQRDREMIASMQKILDERRGLLLDPIWKHRQASIEQEITELEQAIEKLKAKAAVRAERRERIEAKLAGQPTKNEEIAEKLAAERLERAEEALRVYDEQKESGELLEKQVEQIEQELARNREGLAVIEEQIDRLQEDPVMQQALRDRPAVLRHADALIVSGSPLIDLPPTDTGIYRIHAE